MKKSSLFALAFIFLISSCDSPTENNAKYTYTVVLSGTQARSQTLVSDTSYLVVGNLVIPDGITLTVSAGTKILCDYATSAKIIVLAGGSIIANGTTDKPIVFTSNRPSPSNISDTNTTPRQKGDWGGIFIHGKSINNLGTNVITDMDIAAHGGDQLLGTVSGASSLKYVRIEFAGAMGHSRKPLPGLGLYSVPSSTSIENIQVHFSKGDGFFFSGGSVNGKYLVATGNAGYGFVMGNSWIGRGQFWVGIQSSDSKGMYYVYNSLNDPDATASSNGISYMTDPLIYNATLIGKGRTTSPETISAIEIINNGKGKFYKHIIANFQHYAINIELSAKPTDSELENIIELENSNIYVAGIDKNGVSQDYGLADYAYVYGSPSSLSWDNTVHQPPIGIDFLAPLNGIIPSLLISDEEFLSESNSNYNPPAVIPSTRYSGDNINFFNSKATYIGAFDTQNNWMNSWTTWVIQ